MHPHQTHAIYCTLCSICMLHVGHVARRSEVNHGISLVSKVRKNRCSGGEQKGRTHRRCSFQKSSIGHEQPKTATYNLTIANNNCGFSRIIRHVRASCLLHGQRSKSCRNHSSHWGLNKMRRRKPISRTFVLPHFVKFLKPLRIFKMQSMSRYIAFLRYSPSPITVL